MAGRAIEFFERHIGIDLDGDGAVGTRHHTVVPDIENYDDED